MPDNPRLPDDRCSTVNLIIRAHRGERSALEELFARYYPRVRAVVRNRLGVNLRQHLESVDIVQGTLTQAFEGFDEFEWRDDNSLINWLSKLAQFKILEAVDHYSTQSRDTTREVSIDKPNAAGRRLDVPASDKTPSQVATTRESASILHESIAQLSERHRALIALRDFGQLPFPEIASETGYASADAARMAYKAAIRALDQQLRRRGLHADG